MQNLAVKVLAKTAPLRFGIQSALDHSSIKDIPKMHVKKLKSLMSEITKMEAKAQATMSSQALLDLKMEEVSELATSAQSHLNWVQMVLKSCKAD